MVQYTLAPNLTRHNPETDMTISPDTIAQMTELCSRPGQFEACEPWVPYFWSASLDGDGETLWFADEIEAYVFDTTVEEQEAFGCKNYVAVAQDSQGFVIGWDDDDRNALLRTLFMLPTDLAS